MTGNQQRDPWPQISRRGAGVGWQVVVWGVLLGLASLGPRAQAALSTDDPNVFFATVANRLLQSDAALVSAVQPLSPGALGFPASLDGIQIYPTNQYTSALHRVLQVAANLYDAATNRYYGTTNAFPTIFRPLFLTTDTNGTQVFIIGYEELTNHAGLMNQPPMLRRLTHTNNIWVNTRDFVAGIPVVVGARKGFPSFNELELRTKIEVVRKLEFLKHLATDLTPYLTNQMILLSITNEFGVEAWNAWTNPYPRDLQMLIGADLTATLTDDSGLLLFTNAYGNSGPYSNRMEFAINLTVPANTWPGFNPLAPFYSLNVPISPSTAHFMLLTNSSWSCVANGFVSPASTTFEQGLGFPVPRWWFNLSPTLRFILYDTQAQRIVDYVNLAADTPPFDIGSALPHGAVTNGTLDGSFGSMWVTNRVGGVDTDSSSPTFGIINQIYAGLGLNSSNLVWPYVSGTIPPGWDRAGAMNLFRTNLLRLPPLSGSFIGPLFLTNRFYSPFAPVRDLYLYTSWQANDPLVHFTVGDLTRTFPTNVCDWDTSIQNASTLGNIGSVNARYEPWPGEWLLTYGSATLIDARVKDPGILRASDWAFPSGAVLDPASLGRVHRGTPWQTLYLKSQPIDQTTWVPWAGAGALSWPDGFLLHPTNDWRHVGILAPLFNTNPPANLASLNQPSAAAWASLLDGLTAWSILSGTPQPVVVSSNSPQAATIGGAIDALRAAQPVGVFTNVGQILAASALSDGSPWWPTNSFRGPMDALIEALPAQLLARLRPDATAAVTQDGAGFHVRFTGLDGLNYGVQVSADLMTWTTVSTNSPAGGFFDYSEPAASAAPAPFFRSVLWP